MQVGNITLLPRYRPGGDWIADVKAEVDQAARKHVEGDKPVYSRADFDAAPEYAFEETGLYGRHTPVTVGAGTAANDNAPRRGDWMQTYTGKRFWPLDGRPEDVDITDVAHALAMLCRYGGHSLRFYSVAEHSVHIARWLDSHGYNPEIVLSGLLHDATEAYLTDVPRPLKRHLAGYKEYEAALWTVIAEAFGLTVYEDDLPDVVHEADSRILADEIHQNMKPMDWHAKHDNPIGVTLQFWSPDRAEKEFLATFAGLVRRVGVEPVEYPEADREASAADRAYQLRMEEAA